jgi:cation diffusion facilitator family transporter
MPNERLQRSLRTVFAGLAANLVLVAVKLSAGLLGHSYALVADALESLGDVFSSLVVWRGLVVAAAPADQEHPYGHGKAEAIAAAIVAGMLLAAALSIILEAASALFTPPARPAPFTLAVLVATLLLKQALYRYVSREAKALDNLAVQADAGHHRSDAIVSFALAVGISVSLWGGPNLIAADKIAAIAAAGVIAWNGWNLMRPALDELMDAAPDLAFVRRIKSTASDIPGVVLVEKCVMRKAGYQYFADMHVEVDPQLTVLAAHDIAHRVKNRVRKQFPAVLDVLVHIEPARSRGAASRESIPPPPS